MARIRLVVACGLLAVGCVNQPRNFRPAGYGSADEAKPYVQNSLYYSSRLTPEEWDSFFKRFPEYWKDLKVAGRLGSTVQE